MYARCVTAFTRKVRPASKVVNWSVQQATLAHTGKLPPGKADRMRELFCRPVPAWELLAKASRCDSTNKGEPRLG